MSSEAAQDGVLSGSKPGHATGLPPATPAPDIPDHETLRCIGRGSYGEVWLARSVLGEYRAVKVVYRRHFEDDRPFEREFEGIKKFEPISRTHESQVDILHVGRNDQAGCFYYVMELADDANGMKKEECRMQNEQTARSATAVSSFSIRPSALAQYAPRTLKSELAQHGRLPFDECLRIGLALTTALEHLHAHGLVHRDIKPSNIIFVGGIPKLADIGLVASVDATRSFVGTAGYLPPEGPGKPAGDLYSLGKVLYEISVGRDRQDFPALPEKWEQFADQQGLLEFNAVVLKACAHDPGERYASAEAMHADLKLLAEGRSVRHRQTWQHRARIAAKLSLVATAAAALWLLFAFFHASTPPRSNASTPATLFILPFRNDGTNQADEILRSRITDALIDGLAQIGGLKVGGRRIGLQHLSEDQARRQALKEFHARQTVAGTVRTSGDQVSITLGFHDSAQNRVLWSESFAGALTNLALIESRVVRRIAASLGTPLRPEHEREVSAKLFRNQSAYELYQRAFRVFATHGSDYKTRSQMIEYLNRALDLDANFTQAHTALALVYRIASFSDRLPREAMTEVRKCAVRIIEIDPSNTDGHYWLGAVRLIYDYDWTGADVSLRRSFELRPGEHNGKAHYLRCLGRNDAARAEQEKAMEQSPPWGSVPDESFSQFLLDRQYARALEFCRDMAQKEPNEPTWVLCFSQCYRRMGRYEDALEELQKANGRWNPPMLLAEIGMVYAQMGRREDALAVLQKMDEQAGNRYAPPYFKAQIHAALGDKGRALDELEKAYEDRCEQLVNVDYSWGLRTDPSWKDMESEPRFVALLKKVGLDVWPR